MTSKRVVLYARVSTTDQSCDRQIRELTEFAKRRDWDIIEVFSEQISGAARTLPQRAMAMEMARQGRCEAIAISELSRWGRSTADLLSSLSKLAAWDVSLIALNGFDLDMKTPSGRLMTTLLAAIAEFERELLRERVRSGLASARAKGKIGGRPPGTSTKLKRAVPEVQAAIAAGLSVRQVGRLLDLSPDSVRKVLRMSDPNRETLNPKPAESSSRARARD